MNTIRLSKQHWKLLLFATLFMATFQLVARLTTYVFMFHQGVLLLSSSLVGGGIALLLYAALSDRAKRWVVDWLPFYLVVNFTAYIIVYASTQDLFVHFFVLGALFGGLFVAIIQLVGLSARSFTALDLLGSFVGALVIVIAATVLLEEYLISGLLLTYLAVALLQHKKSYIYYSLATICLVAVVLLVYYLAITPLPNVVNCKPDADTYKTICIDERSSLTLTESLPSIKGRSDVYVREETWPRRLSVYNSGLHAGTSIHEDDFAGFRYSFYEVEIPLLDYAPDSRVITLGASTGANVQTLQKYIPEADITAVEIDTTINQLYTNPQYEAYLPERDSFQFVFHDARSIFEREDQQYDIIAQLVESVNTTILGYVDESTSLVYTKEALQTYLNDLAPDGYLILQQYHPAGVVGDAMISKVLKTLDAAVGENTSLADSLLLYSYSFDANPNSQRFLAAIYRPDGFSELDLEAFRAWYQSNVAYAESVTPQPTNLWLLHMPDGSLTYEQYFNEERRASLEEQFSINVITDDRPFRHQVTVLPFPTWYYTVFLLLLGLMLLVFGYVQRKRGIPLRISQLESFVLGIAVFGLQYLLYYKTAAFLNTTLIFFAVFLLVPLFFGGIGALLARYVSDRRFGGLLIGAVMSGIVLLTQPLFSLSVWLVFSMIAVLFVFSGTLFTLLFMRITDVHERSIMYALNICGGGIASLSMITLHATIGWQLTFAGLLALLLLYCIYSIYRYKKNP